MFVSVSVDVVGVEEILEKVNGSTIQEAGLSHLVAVGHVARLIFVEIVWILMAPITPALAKNAKINKHKFCIIFKKCLDVTTVDVLDGEYFGYVDVRIVKTADRAIAPKEYVMHVYREWLTIRWL